MTRPDLGASEHSLVGQSYLTIPLTAGIGARSDVVPTSAALMGSVIGTAHAMDLQLLSLLLIVAGRGLCLSPT